MSDLDEQILKELQETFRVEAGEHLEAINQSLLKLERNPPQAEREKLVQNAFRAAHSLKGAARAVSQAEVEQLAHAMESVLQGVRDSDLALTADACDVLYDSVDAITRLVGGNTADIAGLTVRLHTLTSTPPEAAPVSTEPPPKEVEAEPPPAEPPPVETAHMSEDTIRVSLSKLDDLMAQVGELLVSKISADQRQTDATRIAYQVDQWSKSWREVKALIPRVNGDVGLQLNDVLERHSEQMQALVQSFGTFTQALSRDTVRLGMVTADIQDRVRHVRMVPFQTLVLPLERALRDAARAENKQVTFRVLGSEVELDKKVLETLKDPLMHLLNNAVSHGIEPPTIREQNGKAVEGQVALTVTQRGSEVHITIRDDGRGFDLDALRRSSPDEASGDDEIISLAFLPGVSTADGVTTISGRGVGLDVVRQRIESIQGRISVDNHPGQGVGVSLVVPTSLAMTRGLIVRIGSEHYVMPLLSIEKIVAPDESMVVGGKDMLRVDGIPLPMVPLAAVLERSAMDNHLNPNPLAIVMAVADQRLALLVDDVLTEQEVAVKTLDSPLKRVRNVAGAALLGNGEPIVVLNPADLVKSASRSHRSSVMVSIAQAESNGHSAHILVVDDSITTRTLEKNILEAAGYQITTATHGLEALQRLQENTVDLVVSDIQMPHMDGIVLTSHLREHNEYSELPIILVTSLESREDREKGMLAGADAYIVKRGFDQAELLATIERLL